jgi:hypothetical protein
MRSSHCKTDVSVSITAERVHACLLLIRLVQKANIVNCDSIVGVVLDVVDKLVGICLSPVSSGAVGTSDTTDIASVVLVHVALHVV